MLWEDNTPNESKNKKISHKTERDKILEAVAYYKSKYGITATIVEININSNFSIKKDAIDGITVRKVKDVLPNCFWIT